MTAVANKKPDWLVGASTLSGPILMLVLERPGHAWDVGVRLRQRLPASNIDPKEAIALVERLARRGLLERRDEGHPDKPGKQILVYHPTGLTERAVVDWIQSPVSRESDRGEILTLLAMPEEHAPQLLLRLDDYIAECAVASTKNRDAIPTESWMGMLMELARKAVIMRLEAEIDWAESARDWIEERLASKP